MNTLKYKFNFTFLLLVFCTCNSQTKRTDIKEFGFDGKIKINTIKSYDITDSLKTSMVSNKSTLTLVHTNYYNEEGNLDSTTLYFPKQDSSTFTTYSFSAGVKEGWKKFNTKRQHISSGTINWFSNKEYNVKEFDSLGNLVNETTYRLDDNFRHKVTVYKGFDSTGKLIRNNIQSFELNDKGEIVCYKMENLIQKSFDYTNYRYDGEDLNGNPLRVWMLREAPNTTHWGVLNLFEYTYY